MDEREKAISQALERIRASVVVPPVPETDAIIKQAQEDLPTEKDTFEADRHARDMADRDDNRRLRSVYARRVFALVCVWITAIFVLLVSQVFAGSLIPAYRPLSDSVLIALISSTTVNLIGTLIIVLKYIFRTPGDKS